jgi:hypothetical protein
MVTTTRNPSLILLMGQPEWEVEAILGARRKQNQLQYLVRWKGSPKHMTAGNPWPTSMPMTASGGFTGNTWPLSGQCIKTHFPHQNPSPFAPSASCLPPPLPSTPLSQIPPFPFPLPYLHASLTLREHLDVPSENEEVDDSGFDVPHPDLACELYEIRGTPDSDPADVLLPSTSPAPMGQLVPPGYSHYNKSDFNHGNHRRCITLQPFSTPLFPHYIKFEHNLTSNQHYVYGLHDDAKPPTCYLFFLLCLPYRLPLGLSSLLRHHIPTLCTDYDSSLSIVTRY